MRTLRPVRFAFCITLLVLFAATPARAQWSEDPLQNLVVADRPDGQAQPKIAPTADGGFYVSWLGGGGDGFDVYLQRLDADGYEQWAMNGVRIADRDFSSTQDYGLARSADGGALLAFRFEDGSGTPQIVANRIDADGTPLWDDPGVFVSADASGAASPKITGMPDGGAVVAWTSFDTGAITLQRLDADGMPQWGPDGVALTLPSGVFLIADLHADGAGNVIVSGSAQLSNFDRRLWAQKLDGDGLPLWGADPVEMFDGSDGALQFGYFPPFVTDGDGGAVFAWYQVGTSTDLRVRVQRVLADGSLAFPQNGVDVATGADVLRSAPSAAFDPTTGDTYVIWPEEQQVGTERLYGVSAQRIDATGARQWGDTGRVLVPLGSEQGSQVSALALGDGALFAWSLGSVPNPMRIESARLDVAGAFVWPDEIVPLKTATTPHSRTRGALSTDAFAAYVWADGDEPAVIKAQNIGFDGTLGPVEVETVEYAHDDGDGDTNQGPPSTFDPDMLWGNYFLTEPGGEVITEISVAFGPTFPSLEDGPVTFWLLDDPDMDFDPRNATSLTSVQATPDVFNDNFFTVQIPPTQVSGAFFVGASALLQGGEDRPARVDTNHPGDKSWFFYDPDISAVIDDLASAAFGTRMDNPEFVLFPGAFLIRATGEPGAGTPAVSVDPAEVTITVATEETAETTVTLSNTGTALLTYAVTVAELAQTPDNAIDRNPSNVATGPLKVDPAAGSIAPGESAELTLFADATDLDPATYLFDVQVETNAPAQPVLTIPVTLVVTGGVAADDEATPTAFALQQNHPNPFSGTSTIEFALPEHEHVTLTVFDVTGRRVATLVDGPVAAGMHRVAWDAGHLPAGMYVYRLRAGTHTASLRALLVD